MPVPYISLNGSKIAPFKYDSNPPYGAFINTTKAGSYSVKQVIEMTNGTSFSFVWPSSEHAFHAQKIIHLMKKNISNPQIQQILMDTLRRIERTKARVGEEFLPRDDWDPIVTELTQNHPHLFGRDKRAFDALCDSNYHSVGNPHTGLMPNGEPYTLSFMREVVKLKLEQYPVLKQLAIDCAREGILPIEVSQYDMNWASGRDGNGANMLGIVILELGNQFLKEKEPHTIPPITNPKNYYQQLQRQNLQQLSHSFLVSYTSSMNAWTQPTLSTNTKRHESTHGTSSQGLQYYLSTGGNQRLVIQDNNIVGYEYRNGVSDAWKQSGAPSRYTDLIRRFHEQISQQGLQYYQSTSGNQRLVIKDNNIVGYEYRNGAFDAWKQSGDPSRYTGLIRAFQNQNLHRVTESSPRTEPESDEIITPYPLRQAGNISSSSTNISMMVLGGVIAVVGIAAVAIAFTVLNAATLGIAGLTVASIGVALALSGVGLFAVGANKNSQPMVAEPLNLAPSRF